LDGPCGSKDPAGIPPQHRKKTYGYDEDSLKKLSFVDNKKKMVEAMPFKWLIQNGYVTRFPDHVYYKKVLKLQDWISGY
jgi:hypothetical protein